MLIFNDFKVAVQKQFDKMSGKDQALFVTEAGKDEMWETYLKKFPEGTNPKFRERTEHDCQCCKQFIRACGNVVAIVDRKLISIWDINIGGHYQVVADALSKLVKSKKVNNTFLHYEKELGTDFNQQLLEDGDIIKWNHFYYELPSRFVENKDSIATKLGKIKSNKDVFLRGLKEITLESAETVIELIDQKTLYRGEEHKQVVKTFVKHKKEFDKVKPRERDNYCWLKNMPGIRNTVIGTLLVDISNDKDLDEAVKLFESKVAPENYQRPTAIITKSMISNAQKKVVELGIEGALKRRYATVDDITIKNILFADRTTKKAMNVFDELAKEAPQNTKNLKKVEEVDIETFIKTILPKSDSVEIMVENSHTHNLMSLIAPEDVEAKNIFKWHNNFSWAYNGEVADSMKDRVKAAGGRVDGVFRFTHSWNKLERNQSLMDLHVFMPGNSHNIKKIHNSYGRGRRVGWNHRSDAKSGGVQDVDYVNQAPTGYIPIENITFPTLSKMPEGEYICKIHNWDFRNSGGRGEAEIEFGGTIHQYEYPKTKHHEWITVAKVTLKDGQFSIKHNLDSSTTSREVWGLSTQQFHKVNMVMNSPNHWDDKTTGNKHYFFILEDCCNDEKARGFFNEFLNENLREHRKVFEVLGSKMKAEVSDNQLSGLGFSSTQKNHVFCKVTGSFTRTIKLIF